MNVLITIPVYNEEKIIKKNIFILNNYLLNNFKYKYTIEIVDNGSIDNTVKIAKSICKNLKHVKLKIIKEQGKGNAIKNSWHNSSKEFDILSFMDVDLATDISYFPKLINFLNFEDYDISIGSRYEKESIVKRSFIRQVFAKSYLFLQKLLFNIPYNDSQCGFKAIKRSKYLFLEKYFLKKRLWFDKVNMFFDTELLIIANNILNYKIKSVPIKWTSQKESKVKIIRIVIIFFIYLVYLRIRLFNIKK